jgi:hypothetical protein
MCLHGSEGRRGGVCRQFFGPFAAGASTNQGRRPMPLVQRDSRPRPVFVKVSQPGSGRYGGGCNPDATRMPPGCNGLQSGATGWRPGCPQGVAAGRPEAVACNALDGV